MKHALVALFAAALCWTAFGQSTNGGGGSIGSLPKTIVVETGPCSGSTSVDKGETKTNADGVSVKNAPDSSGKATLTPENGTPDCDSEARTKTGFKGEISGLDTGDQAILGSSNTATISGTGGYVSISGGSAVTVTNTGTPPGASITVVLPSGTTASVPPGSSVTFGT